MQISPARRLETGACRPSSQYSRLGKSRSMRPTRKASSRRSKGCLSNKTALAMIFKLAEAAERNWRRLNGHNQLPKIILGIKFTDGMEIVRSQAQPAAA